MRRALGDTTSWDQWYAKPGEVYVWRTPYTGADFETPEDGMALLRALARASTLKLDVRGIVFGTYRSDGQKGVDLVMTADSTIPYAVPQSARRLAEVAIADPALRRRFPQLAFGSASHGGPKFVALTGPPDAIDFWVQHPIVWDDRAGPMEAFAKLRGVYGGEADDGPRLNEWRHEEPDLGPNGKNGTDKPPTKTAAALKWGMWIAAGAAAAWIGARVYEETAA